jgi:lipooligosaccharide transport system permease protein
MYSAYTRMAVQRTWSGMLSAPLEVRDIVIGETLWAGTKSLISVSAILVVAGLLGAVQGAMALWVLPVVLLTGISFGAMALVVTAFARSYDFFLYYQTLVVTPMLLLGGVFFPLQSLPPLVQSLAALLPLVHAVQLVRPLMVGAPAESAALHLTVLAGYALAALWLATRLVERRLTS